MEIEMEKINASNSTDQTMNNLSAFASDLGLEPGEWPKEIPTDLGNGQPFMKSEPALCSRIYREDDVACTMYYQLFGSLKVVIYND